MHSTEPATPALTASPRRVPTGARCALLFGSAWAISGWLLFGGTLGTALSYFSFSLWINGIFAFGCPLLGFLAALDALLAGRRKITLLARGTLVQGTVVKCGKSGDPQINGVVFQFSTPTGATVTKAVNSYTKLHVGDTVPVLYDPQHPVNAHLYAEVLRAGRCRVDEQGQLHCGPLTGLSVLIPLLTAIGYAAYGVWLLL